MLTAKQNMIECMKPDGKPDRFVNQYEAISLQFHPFGATNPSPQKGEENIRNAWGVYNSWPAEEPGAFPVHSEDKLLIKDIEHWKDVVKAPPLDFPDEMWNQFQDIYAAIDGEKAFKATFINPGLFEQTHHMCDMVNALFYYVDYEDEMHDLIKYLTEWELRMADDLCSKLHPDMIFHHDDWGSHDSTFISPAMFDEFLLEPYKEIYGYFKSHGVQYIVHHCDSYAATLVPEMIEMGIDVYQGCMETNNIGELIEKYGDKISFMGGIEDANVDFEDWTDENCEKEARRVCETYGMKSYIPCVCQGGPGSVYPGVYMSLNNAIDKINQEQFGFTPEQQAEMRVPIQIIV